MEQAFSSMALLLASCLRSSQASQNSMFSSLYSVRRNSRKTFRPAGFLISLSNDWDHNRISSTEGLVLSGDKRRLFLIHTEGVFRKFKQIPPWPHGKDSMRGNVCLCFPSVFRKRAVFKSVLLSQVSTVSFTKAAAGISLRTKSCCGSHKSEIRPNVLKCARCSEESMSEQAQLQSDHRSSAERAGPRGSAAGRMFPQWHTLAWNEKKHLGVGAQHGTLTKLHSLWVPSCYPAIFSSTSSSVSAAPLHSWRWDWHDKTAFRK